MVELYPWHELRGRQLLFLRLVLIATHDSREPSCFLCVDGSIFIHYHTIPTVDRFVNLRLPKTALLPAIASP